MRNKEIIAIILIALGVIAILFGFFLSLCAIEGERYEDTYRGFLSRETEEEDIDIVYFAGFFLGLGILGLGIVFLVIAALLRHFLQNHNPDNN